MSTLIQVSETERNLFMRNAGPILDSMRIALALDIMDVEKFDAESAKLKAMFDANGYVWKNRTLYRPEVKIYSVVLRARNGSVIEFEKKANSGLSRLAMEAYIEEINAGRALKASCDVMHKSYPGCTVTAEMVF